MLNDKDFIFSNLFVTSLSLLYDLQPTQFQNYPRQRRPELWPLIWARKITHRVDSCLITQFRDVYNTTCLSRLL